MIKARFQVAKGEFKDSLIFENYIISHSNPMVEEISLRKLRELAMATGSSTTYETIGDVVADLDNFVELPFLATVGIREPYTNAEGKVRIDNSLIKTVAR